jgi:signal transduction histidine kinase
MAWPGNATPWRTEPPPRRWRIYAATVALLAVPFVLWGLVSLAHPPVGFGFLAGFFVMLVIANMCIVELPPYRFLHLATGIVSFGGFFVAGPATIGLLALSIKPSELVARWARRVAGIAPDPFLGGLTQEYIVPSTGAMVVLGVMSLLGGRIGLHFPAQPTAAWSEAHLYVLLAVMYTSFVVLSEIGVVLRFGAGRVFDPSHASTDLLTYLVAVLLGAPVVSGIPRVYASDAFHTLFSLGWMFWGLGGFLAAWLLARRRLEIERLIIAASKQERLAALGGLASVIAHQTRHHLGILNMSAYVLGDTLAEEPLSPRAREAVTRELEAIARTRSELDKLLAQELRGGGHEERFGVLALARECAKHLGPLLATREVTLRFADGERSILGDRLRLKQAITNVLRNAIEASPHGSEVQIELVTGAASVCLAVLDQGPGLSPAAQKHLFEPLFTEKSEGLGMGLYVARAIVEAHGGEIALASTAQGTRVELRLAAGP